MGHRPTDREKNGGRGEMLVTGHVLIDVAVTQVSWLLSDNGLEKYNRLGSGSKTFFKERKIS